MKKFVYDWQDDIYLIHFELESNTEHDFNFEIIRHFKNGISNVEKNCIVPIDGTFRSIISRKSSDELSFEIIYNDDDVLKAFLVLDRAFYPTIPFYQQ